MPRNGGRGQGGGCVHTRQVQRRDDPRPCGDHGRQPRVCEVGRFREVEDGELAEAGDSSGRVVGAWVVGETEQCGERKWKWGEEDEEGWLPAWGNGANQGLERGRGLQ